MDNRLQSIELRGYKSIADLQLTLRPINILIGANGSGKSNLISFFRLLNYLCTGSLQRFVALGGGAGDHLHFGPKRTPQLDATVTFEALKGANKYHLRLAHGAGDRLVFLEESVSYCAKGMSWSTAPVYSLGTGHLESLLPVATHDVTGRSLPPKTAATVQRLMRQWQVFQFHDTSSTAHIKQSGFLEEFQFLRSDAGNLAAFLLHMRNSAPQNYARVVQTVQRVLPAFKDFSLEPNTAAKTISLNWHHRSADNLFGSHQLSDGSLRFMALCALLLQPRLPALILLDEPELGLHPYAIELLGGLIQSAASECQIVFSTQSVELANQFTAEDCIVVDQVNDSSTFHRLDSSNLTKWLERYRIGDIWVKNLVGGTPE